MYMEIFRKRERGKEMQIQRQTVRWTDGLIMLIDWHKTLCCKVILNCLKLGAFGCIQREKRETDQTNKQTNKHK